MTVILIFYLEDEIKGQKTGYQISSRNYISTPTKMIANDIYLLWKNYTTMTYGLAFDLEVDLEGQMSVQRSWLCKTPKKASCRLRPF